MQRERTVSTHDTLEDLGRSGLCVEVQLEGTFTPAEPTVMYYPDGSGYPGCDACCQYNGCYVTQVTGECYDIRRSERPDWFAYLDQCVDNYIRNHPESFEERLLDSLDD